MTEVATKERGILFNSEMVRGILGDRKTNTRRPMVPQPHCDDEYIRFPWATFFANGVVHTWDRDGDGGENWNADDYPNENKFEVALRRTPYTDPSPFGLPGDQLYVRETYAPNYFGPGQHGYRADWDPAACEGLVPEPRWTPSIHMKREHSRITLEVERVWVERVHDIDEDGALEEGIMPDGDHGEFWFYDHERWCHVSAVEAFRSIWDSIYAAKGLGWKDNPWVWCCEFKRVEQV